MKYNTVLFDFDGTLADTEDAMRESLNSISKRFGFRPVKKEERNILREMSTPDFLVARLRVPVWNILKTVLLIRAMQRAFNKHVDALKLFPGMADLIHSLHKEGYRVGIVSTNSVRNIRHVIGDLQSDIDCIQRGSVLFGKSRALKRIIRKYHLDRMSVLYIGDELRDAHLCRTLGIPMIGVGWGLNSAEALGREGIEVALTPEELRRRITSH